MTIAEFLLRLVSDADLFERFASHPDEVLAESKLSDEQRAILRAASLDELRVKLKAEFKVAGETCSMITIYSIPTIYAPPPPPPDKK